MRKRKLFFVFMFYKAIKMCYPFDFNHDVYSLKFKLLMSFTIFNGIKNFYLNLLVRFYRLLRSNQKLVPDLRDNFNNKIFFSINANKSTEMKLSKVLRN